MYTCLCVYVPVYVCVRTQLSFVAQVPALGLSVYQLSEGAELQTELSQYVVLQQGNELSIKGAEDFHVAKSQVETEPIIIENAHLQLKISPSTGLLEVTQLTTSSCVSTCDSHRYFTYALTLILPHTLSFFNTCSLSFS